MARVNPELKVFFGGVEYNVCGADSRTTEPILVDAIRVDWGRSDYMEHQTPASSTCVVYDRTGTIRDLAAARRLVGEHIAYYAGYWTSSPGAPGDWVWYHGRISSVKVERVQTRNGSVGADGYEWKVTITSASVEAGIGNIVYPSDATTWTEDTMVTRAVLLRDTQQGVTGISDIFFYGGHVTSWSRPVEIKDKNVLDLVNSFYMSMGDTYSYLPDQNCLRYLFRRAMNMTDPIVQYATDYNGTNYVVHIASTGIAELDGNTWTYPGATIPACEVEAGSEMELTPNVVISRVEYKWQDWFGAGAGNDRTSFLPDPADDTYGRRTLRIDGWLGDGARVDDVVFELWARVREEGSVPRHPDIVWDTRRFGGFPNKNTARNLIMAGEHQGMSFVEGSPFSEFMVGWAPQYAVIGGSIVYEDGGWVVKCRFQQFYEQAPNPAPTWSSLNTSLDWGDRSEVGSSYSYSHSVSWGNMQFLGVPGTVYASMS